MAIRDFPGDEWLTRDKRAKLLDIFALPEAEKAKLLRWNFDHAAASTGQRPPRVDC